MLKKILFAMLSLSSALNGLENPLTPDAALKKLMEGNERFVNDKVICRDETQKVRESLVANQYPFATVIACSDSRVSPDLIFNQGLGDLFVVRDAGNTVSDSELDSIEYAVTHLNTSIVLVLGHAGCGAVTAVLNGDTHHMQTIEKKISPFIKGIKPNDPNALKDAVIANVRGGVQVIRESARIKPLIEQNKVKVVGGYYHLDTGRVTLL